mmetsp:Transcript_6245/g.11102  ORF Transcript_6245/g.11102 Transcript_6245/m.11102 type:complete len:383 (-) Transcript_6245:462-1610(-)
MRRAGGGPQARAFLERVARFGNAGLCDRIELRPSGLAEDSGLGVFAAAPLKAGEPVVKIGKELWKPLSADEAWGRVRDKLPEVQNSLIRFTSEAPMMQGANSQAKVMLVGSVSFILHLLNELDKGEGSEAWYHVSMIPSSLDVPLFWGPEKIAELQASPLASRITEQRTLVSAVYAQVVQPNMGSTVSSSNFAWAWSLLLSRAISNVSQNLPFCVPPLLDMFNHRFLASSPLLKANNSGYCDHIFDPESASFAVIPRFDVEAGQELHISYGAASNATLLRKYGFALHNNPYDHLKLKTGDVQIRCNYNGEIEMHPKNALDENKIEFALKSQLEAYGTTLEEDNALLEQNNDKGRDWENAVLTRIGEKRALTHALARLDGMMY